MTTNMHAYDVSFFSYSLWLKDPYTDIPSCSLPTLVAQGRLAQLTDSNPRHPSHKRHDCLLRHKIRHSPTTVKQDFSRNDLKILKRISKHKLWTKKTTKK